MSSSKKPQMSQDSHWLLFLVTFVIKIYAIIITTKILKPAKTITRLILTQTFTYLFFIGCEFFLPKKKYLRLWQKMKILRWMAILLEKCSLKSTLSVIISKLSCRQPGLVLLSPLNWSGKTKSSQRHSSLFQILKQFKVALIPYTWNISGSKLSFQSNIINFNVNRTIQHKMWTSLKS